MVVKMNHANQWQWHMEQTQRLWVCKWENLGQGFCSNMPIKWLESAIESMRLDREKKQPENMKEVLIYERVWRKESAED